MKIESGAISSECDSDIQMAKKILAEVMRFRRISKSSEPPCNLDCPKCVSPHLLKMIFAIKKNEPVIFLLPGFPGKSPNQAKVLGHLPDHAERLSLLFLSNLCKKIKKYYAPGMKIILCSDGRVFSDVVGMAESHVTAYQIELKNLITGMALHDLSLFNLDDFYGMRNFEKMRDVLMKNYGNTLDSLKDKVRLGAKISAHPDEKEANRLFCGIARFLFEDALYPGQQKSKAAIQKESRIKAYELIRRSNAWSNLIADRFPQGVRLSIHPQTCGSKKLGILLIGNEIWMTPWHAVAVETRAGYLLLKRSEAEALGAELIHSSNGQPSHYRLMTDQPFCREGVAHGL